MSSVRLITALGIALAIVAAPGASDAWAQGESEGRYAVMSPWADADPLPLRGISQRIDTLAGKKIGLFVNYKRAARPIGQSLEKRLTAMFPASSIHSFHSPEWNVSEIETRNKDKFTAWAKEMDAVILLVGD